MSLADIIKFLPINQYRDKFLQFKEGVYDAINESSFLQIKYDVDNILKSFIDLSYDDLINCAKDCKTNCNSFQSALDYIYLSRNIIKKPINQNDFMGLI